MERPLVIFAGVSKKEDTGIYRRHNYLGENKAGIPFLDSYILTEALRNYSLAEHEGVGFGPIYLLGKKENLQPYVPDNLEVIIHDSETTLGDKLRFLDKFGDQMIYVASCDLVPAVEDLNAMLKDIDSRENVAVYLPFIEGDDLIEIGFRTDRGHKMYPVRKDERIDFFSASQMYALRPSMLKLDSIAEIADERFKAREYGIRNPKILWSIMKNLDIGCRDVWRAFRTFIGITAKPGKSGDYFDSWIRRIPTYEQVRHTFSPVLKKEARRTSNIEIGLLHAPTLAMDVDCEDEKLILERYFSVRNGRNPDSSS